MSLSNLDRALGRANNERVFKALVEKKITNSSNIIQAITQTEMNPLTMILSLSTTRVKMTPKIKRDLKPD